MHEGPSVAQPVDLWCPDHPVDRFLPRLANLKRILQREGDAQRLPVDQVPAPVDANLLADDARLAEADIVGIVRLARVVLVGLCPGQIVIVIRPERDVGIADPARLDVQGPIVRLQAGADRLRGHHRPRLAIGLLDPELGIGLDDLRGKATDEHARQYAAEIQQPQCHRQFMAERSHGDRFSIRGEARATVRGSIGLRCIGLGVKGCVQVMPGERRGVRQLRIERHPR